MHRIFLDQNVRIEIADLLRQEGHEVVHASEAKLQRRDDEVVFRWAADHQMALVTFDADFAERAYWRREQHQGIVRLRLEPQTPTHVFPILRRFFASCQPEKLQGALVVIAENKVRFRHS